MYTLVPSPGRSFTVASLRCQLSSSMLLPSEKENLYGLAGVHDGYKGLFAKIKDKRQHVCASNQHPVKRPTTAHSDGSLPTFLASGNQKLWSFQHERWLSGREKFAAMGWPSTPALAKILERPLADAWSCQAHERIGNGMHLFNCVMVVASVLSSVEIIDPKVQRLVLKAASGNKSRCTSIYVIYLYFYLSHNHIHLL